MTDFADLPPYKFIVRQLTRGLVIPFLGAGANVTLSNAGTRFEPGRRLPSGRELAEHLADEFGYSDEDGRNDLLHVSQWVSTIIGPNTLYDALHTLFDLTTCRRSSTRCWPRSPGTYGSTTAGSP